MLLLEAAALSWDGHLAEALQCYRDAAAIHYAVRGGSFHFQRFMDLCLVAGAAVAANDADAALDTLRLAYRTCCKPFCRSQESFRFLAHTYCSPRWRDVAAITPAQAAALQRRQADLLRRALEDPEDS